MSGHAVVRIQDVQFRVSENAVLKVPKLSQNAGESVTFDQVLLIDGDEPKIGSPLVEGAKVTAQILEHGRGDKVLAFKYKRRKGHRKTIGSRPSYTAIRITGIEG